MPPSTPSLTLFSAALQRCSSSRVLQIRPLLSHSQHAFVPARAPARRTIHSSPIPRKQKGGKQESKRTVEKAQGTVNAKGDDPNDFSTMEKAFEKAQALMQDTLSKLRSGGRFNHELLEQLKVKIGNESANLGDVAQVIPRGGRQINVLVGEQDHVKPVSSAIMASPYSLNPTTSKDNPLELQIAVPPPTAESRKLVLAEADKAAEKTYHTIRQARGAQQKKMQAIGKAVRLQADVLPKATKDMEKLVEAANKKTKEMVEKAKKALEG